MRQDFEKNHRATVIDGIESSAELVARIRKVNDTTLLAFSCGKDSIAAWLALRGKFKIVPYYCYLVPDLEFVEESLTYYEKFFGQRIIRVPHPSLYRWLNNFVFCPPERCATIEASGLPSFNRKELNDAIKQDLKIPQDTPCATGVRSADSIIRRIHFKTHGPYNQIEHIWYPIWDWTADMMRDALIESGVKLPSDYLLFGRSFDGIDYRFLKPIKKHFPNDYIKIIEAFPLAALEFKRKEYSL